MKVNLIYRNYFFFTDFTFGCLQAAFAVRSHKALSCFIRLLAESFTHTDYRIPNTDYRFNCLTALTVSLVFSSKPLSRLPGQSDRVRSLKALPCFVRLAANSFTHFLAESKTALKLSILNPDPVLV